MALLLRRAPGVFEYAVYDARVGLELGATGWALPAVTRRHRFGEHLVHGVPVHTEHSGRFPDAHPLHQAGLANAKIQIHDVHPSHLPQSLDKLFRKLTDGMVLDRRDRHVYPPSCSIMSPPFIPLSHGASLDVDAIPNSAWYAMGLQMLSRCDELRIFGLDGWEASVGVTLEIKYTKQLRIPASVADPSTYEV